MIMCSWANSILDCGVIKLRRISDKTSLQADGEGEISWNLQFNIKGDPEKKCLLGNFEPFIFLLWFYLVF